LKDVKNWTLSLTQPPPPLKPACKVVFHPLIHCELILSLVDVGLPTKDKIGNTTALSYTYQSIQKEKQP